MSSGARDRLNGADLTSLLLAGMIVVGALLAPVAERLGIFPEASVCLSQRIAGLPCPGCGMTRSVIALGRGEIGRSLHLNWVAPAMFLLAVAHLTARAFKWFGHVSGLRRFDLATLFAVSTILIVRSIQIWT